MLGSLRRYQLVLVAVIVAFVAALLYWPTLALPLLFDDLLHIRIAENLDLFNVWLPSNEFGWFRPLVFLPFLIIKPLFGYYPQELLHAINLLQQMLNSLLLTTLVWRLWQDWRRALSAGLLLASFPFAYQAVASYGNNIHLFSTGLILLGLHAYLCVIRTHGQRRWWIITAGLFLIGLLSHESVVLFGPLAALIHWVDQGEFPWKRDGRRTSLVALRDIDLSNWMRSIREEAPFLPLILVGGLYVVIYQFLPLGPSPDPNPGGSEPLPVILYLMQSASYPFAWFAHRLPDLSAVTIIYSSFGLTLAWTLWAAKRAENRLPLFLGWTWWGLASLVVGINLPTYYILHSARILYLGGVGAIFVWTVLLGTLFRLPTARRWIWVVALGFILVTSWAFVRDRLAAFAEISAPLESIEKEMAGRPVDEGILLVNLPQWTAPARNTYAAGVEYVTLMGTHLFAEELISENLGGNRPVLAIGLPELHADSGYPYGVHDQTDLDQIESGWAPAGSHVFISRYTETGIETEYTGQFTPSTSSSALAHFDPYVLTTAQANLCDNVVQVTLTWIRSETKELVESTLLPETTSSFVQLLDEAGRLITQLDGPPLRLRPNLIQLQPGWQMVDQRTLPLVGEGYPSLTLVGIYDFNTGERFPALTGDDLPLPDDAFRFPVNESCDDPEAK